MKFRHLLGEAFRDTKSGTSRALTLWFMTSLLVGGLVLFEGFAVKSLIEEANAFRSDGAAITTVIAPNGIDGEACEKLSELPGILASGALRKSDAPIEPVLLPRSPIPAFDVTPGLPSVLGVSQPAAGVVVAADVLIALGQDPGDADFSSSRGEVAVGGVYAYPSDGRRPGFAWAALIPTPTREVYDECWAFVWPSNADLRRFFISTVPTLAFSASGAQVEVSQLNTQLGTNFDGYERFENRVTRFVPVAASMAVLMISYIAVRLRRLEIAARLHDGMSRPQLALLMTAGAASWLVPASLVSAAIGTLLAVTIGGPDGASMAYTGFAIGAASIVSGIVGTLFATSQIRERHLFIYFKER